MVLTAWEERKLRLLLEVGGLTYVSSAGLRALAILSKKVSGGGGGYGLCSPSGIVREVMSMSGFERKLTVYDTLAGAFDE